MPINQSGRKLWLEVNGSSQLDSAQVEFGNGQTQTIDFQRQTYSRGSYPILDFGSDRYVKSVKLVARADSPYSNLTLDLQN